MTWSLVFLVLSSCWKMGFCMGPCLLMLRWFSTLSWHPCWKETETREQTTTKHGICCSLGRGERSFSSTNNEEGLPSPCLTWLLVWSQMKETTNERGRESSVAAEKERKKLFLLHCWCWCSSSTLPLITKLDKSQTNKRQANIRFWLCFPAVVRLIYRLLGQILDVFYINLHVPEQNTEF